MRNPFIITSTGRRHTAGMPRLFRKQQENNRIRGPGSSGNR